MIRRQGSAGLLTPRCLTFCCLAVQALAALFMMNNEHFMVKTVEGSEALMLLGPDWLERQKDKARHPECFSEPVAQIFHCASATCVNDGTGALGRSALGLPSAAPSASSHHL